MKYNVLIVDDEENILSSLELAMEKHYKVFCASDGKTALDIFRKQNIHIVFLDLTLDDTDGLSVLKEMKSINSYAEIVIITATNDIPTAVFATKLGAYDYITKPYEISRLLLLAKKITEKIELENEVAILRSIKSEESGKDIFIAKSKALKEIKKLINKVSLNKSTILITGKSGTGKEVIAREIHFSGNDKKKPFVPVHTGALSDGIIESELFGHEKGSFTGAHERKIGKFEFANGGTIFLDEISTMNTAMQIKLLRVLQDKTFYRVGSTVPIKVDVRIIAATNTDIEEEVKKGTFREDLFYRFNVLRINIPPLAKRPEDIEPLAIFFLKMYSRQFQKDILGFSDEALKALKNYHWPGNVRELKNIIERSIVLTENKSITLEDLPLDISIIKKYEQNKSPNMKETKKELDSYEKDFLIKRLKEYRWNKIKTANSLGIHRNTLLYKIKKFNILKETT